MTSGTLFGAPSAALLLSILTAVGCSGSGSSARPAAAQNASGAGGTGGQGGEPAAGGSPAAVGVDPQAGGPASARSSIARTPLSAVPTSALSAAVAANNAFAVDLYAHVLQQAGTNVLTSPLSASLALTMTYAGANGATKTEMASALHLDPNAGDAVFAGQNALSQALNGRAAAAFAEAQQSANQNAPPSDADYQLQVLNSVWGEKTYTWEQPFLDILAANYGTGVYQQDFINSPDAARLTINDWVDTHTGDKIKNLLPPDSIDGSTRMVLVNTIHLKLPWYNAFEKERTEPGDFERGDSSKVSTPFMNQTNTFGYVDDGQAQVVSLPLSNRELSIVIALPHTGVALAQYEATLTASSAPFVLPSTSELVSLSLPKTTFTSDSFSLKAALQQMGMNLAFKDADFSGLCAHPPDGATLYVKDVLQKAMISMAEPGVEAAAATAVIISAAGVSAVAEPPPLTMNVNRPYLVALIDNPTGAVLMLGHIQDPSDAGGP
jgi:serpin B